jgi:hypothetical protein
MSEVFLLALFGSLVCIFFSLNTEDAWAAFFAIAAGACLLISLILASWVVKVVVLVGALAGMRYYCHRHACEPSALKDKL